MLLKSKPEDFVVEEILDLDTKEKGNYVYFLLEKRNWTTLKALQFIAKKLNTNAKRFAVAGQKDRYAVTKQYFSAYQISERQMERVIIKDIKITLVGFGDAPIALGQLKGNKFRLVARELKKPLEYKTTVVNYYDNQRFGGYRPNLHKIGKEVLLGNYEQAIKLYLLYPFPNETEDYVAARKWMEENWGSWDENKFPKYLIMERKIISFFFEK